MRLFALLMMAAVQASLAAASELAPVTPPPLRVIEGEHFELNDNGAWSWFMDERAIVDQGRVLVGSIRGSGEFIDSASPDWGNVELSVFELATHRRQVVVLAQHFEQDDHDCLDVNVVYISTDADPLSGKPLISKANFRRHHELYRGVTRDDGQTWKWSSITANSSTDNLRPLVPVGNDPGKTALIWMRGAYRVNRGEWSTKVMLTVLPSSPE